MRELKFTKRVRCMNHNPKDSKYGDFAPIGGCDAWVDIDSKSVKGLCWKCTSNAANNVTTRKNEE